MRSAKSRLLAVLIVAALGVLAFASSAQAITELASSFFIGGAQVGALKASVTAKQLGVGTLSIPALNTEINCNKFSITSSFINSTTDGDASFLYEECTVLTISTKAEQPCHIVVNHTTDKRLHITATALLLPAELTDGTPAVLFEKIVATVLTEEGTECTLPKTTKIPGEACFRVLKNHTAEPELETNQTIQKSCNPRLTLEGIEFSGTLAEREKLEAEGKGVLDKILFGINEAFITAKADIRLTGAHEGKTLGVLLDSPPSTMWCKAQTGSCEAYGVGSKLTASLENELKFVFPYEGEELEPPCRVSSVGGATTKEGEEILSGELTALTFKECGGGLCTVVAQHLPYKFVSKATVEGNGTMTWSSGGGGAPGFAIKCLGLMKCVYGAAEMTFTITGGSPAKMSNTGVALKREEGSEAACGEAGAKWEGVAGVEGKVLYKITGPSPLFVRII
jgi:hypothetical protein